VVFSGFPCHIGLKILIKNDGIITEYLLCVHVRGANAVNGIINIITKKASDTSGSLLSVGAGNYEQAFAYARVGKIYSERLAGRGYVKYQNKDNYQHLDYPMEKQGAAGDQWKSIKAGFRLDGDLSSQDTWTLQGDFFKNHENQNVSLWGGSLLHPFNVVKDDFEAMGWNILSRWNHQIDKQTAMNLQVYVDHTERDEVYLGQKYDVLDIDFQYQSKFAERHNVIWGASYRYLRDHFDNKTVTIDPARTQSDLFSIFAQDEIELVSEQWNLMIGAKLEYHESTGYEFQPNIRLAWMIDPGQTLWSSVSRAVRTPSRYERNAHTIAAFRAMDGSPRIVNVFGSEQFDSEKLVAYELGYRSQLNSRASIDIALFNHEASNLLSSRFDPGILIPSIHVGNDNESKTYGIEIAADWNYRSWWRLQSSYSFAKMTKSLEINSRSGSLPKHQLSLRSLIDVNDNVQLDLWAV